jgi:hypothetical protein
MEVDGTDRRDRRKMKTYVNVADKESSERRVQR